MPSVGALGPSLSPSQNRRDSVPSPDSRLPLVHRHKPASESAADESDPRSGPAISRIIGEPSERGYLSRH
jgi:hypothetical protein